MQNQILICDQQKMYALGCSLLLKDHLEIKDCLHVDYLPAIDDKSQLGDTQLLIIDSGLIQFQETTSKYAPSALQCAIPIVVVFNQEEDHHLYQIIESGVSVVVSRNTSSEELIKAIQMAFQHKTYFCSIIAKRVFDLVNQADKIKNIETIAALSKYDKYILIRICEEASSKQIAYEMGFSKRTIEGHRTKLMQKLEVKNLAGLVKAALLSSLYKDYLANPGLYEVTSCFKTSSL